MCSSDLSPRGPQRSRGRFKVYVREPGHLEAIRQALDIPLFASSQIVYLQGDLCRRELLVEIEGVLTTD